MTTNQYETLGIVSMFLAASSALWMVYAITEKFFDGAVLFFALTLIFIFVYGMLRCKWI